MFFDFFNTKQEPTQIGSAKISYEKDIRSTQQYTIVEGFDSSELDAHNRVEVMKLLPKGAVVAQKGKDAVVKLEGNKLLIFRDAEADVLRKEIVRDKTDYKYQVNFKISEYHNWMEFIRLDDSEPTRYYGSAPKEKGAWYDVGTYLRNDTYYNDKYFHGNVFWKPGEYNPKMQIASSSLAFNITEEQAHKAFREIESFNEYTKENSVVFDFFGKKGTAGNCMDYANKIFNIMGFEGHYAHFYKMDELDARDQGVLYLLWDAYGTANLLVWNHDMVRDLGGYHYLNGNTFGEYWNSVSLSFFHNLFSISGLAIYDWLLGGNDGKYFYGNTFLHICAYNNEIDIPVEKHIDTQGNEQNSFGDTPLHTALITGNIEFAKKLVELGVDINISNNKGETPLHILSDLESSEAKHELLKLLIAEGADVNAEDLGGYETPLTRAVLSNDPEAVQILKDSNADISFINRVKDSLMQAAVNKRSFDVVKLLDQEQLTLDNPEFQIPICLIHEQTNYEEILHEYDWDSFDESICKSHSQIMNKFDYQWQDPDLLVHDI